MRSPRVLAQWCVGGACCCPVPRRAGTISTPSGYHLGAFALSQFYTQCQRRSATGNSIRQSQTSQRKCTLPAGCRHVRPTRAIADWLLRRRGLSEPHWRLAKNPSAPLPPRSTVAHSDLTLWCCSSAASAQPPPLLPPSPNFRPRRARRWRSRGRQRGRCALPWGRSLRLALAAVVRHRRALRHRVDAGDSARRRRQRGRRRHSRRRRKSRRRRPSRTPTATRCRSVWAAACSTGTRMELTGRTCCRT